MWDRLNGHFKEFRRGITTVAFPNVCVCCGTETTEQERQLCSFCKEERFEVANRSHSLNSSDTILPECVSVQHALWKFDQGGTLQDLLHYLKYELLTGIGVELGKILGESMSDHPVIKKRFFEEDVVFVPVPLHYLRFRKRGFNQAFMIAKGVSQVWDFPICEIDSVIRSKNTHSQTGFSLSRRIANMKNAFLVKKPETFQNKLAVIVDDVFTTGSTTFELARTLKESGCSTVFIATVAQV